MPAQLAEFHIPEQNAVPSHVLRFIDWGDPAAAKTAICVHGLTRNAHDFDRLAAALVAKGYRVLVPDMAGRGESDYLPDSTQYHYGTYVADCIALMDNFHLRGVDWIGTSMGGLIGMMIAAQHKNRIRRLVLNDIGPFIPKAALIRILRAIAATPTEFANRAEAEAQLRLNMASFGITQESDWQGVLTHGIRESESGRFRLNYDRRILEPLMGQSGDFSDIADVNLTALWEHITMATLVIRGAESDLLEKETLSAMRAANLKCQSIEIPATGHAPMLMNSSEINAITGFLS